MPQPREELASATLDGTLYVIGGYDANGRDTNTVFAYTTSWSPGPPLPEPLDHLAAAVVNDRLYVVGGFSGGQATTITYRLAGDHWEWVASLHHARAALALVPLGGLLYALGGRNSAMGSVAIAEVFDPATGAWSDLPAMPAPRHHMAGFAYDGMACGAGGKFPYTARIDCFDPATGTWRRLPDLPQATSGAGAIVLDNELIIAGGQGTPSSPGFSGWTARPGIASRCFCHVTVCSWQSCWTAPGPAAAERSPTCTRPACAPQSGRQVDPATVRSGPGPTGPRHRVSSAPRKKRETRSIASSATGTRPCPRPG